MALRITERTGLNATATEIISPTAKNCGYLPDGVGSIQSAEGVGLSIVVIDAPIYKKIKTAIQESDYGGDFHEIPDVCDGAYELLQSPDHPAEFDFYARGLSFSLAGITSDRLSAAQDAAEEICANL